MRMRVCRPLALLLAGLLLLTSHTAVASDEPSGGVDGCTLPAAPSTTPYGPIRRHLDAMSDVSHPIRHRLSANGAGGRVQQVAHPGATTFGPGPPAHTFSTARAVQISQTGPSGPTRSQALKLALIVAGVIGVATVVYLATRDDDDLV